MPPTKTEQQLHHVAMLKLVLRMKREPQQSFETLSHDIATSMKLDELAFQRFLAHYMPSFTKVYRHSQV